MKKVNLFLIAIACVLMTSAITMAQTVETSYSDFWFSGDFHTYDYASKVDFFRWENNNWWSGVWIGTNPLLPDYLDWTHELPLGLTVPPDHVDRARLWVEGAFIDTDNNTIEIEGIVDWDPLNHQWLDNSSYWLTDVSVPGFWNDGDLNVRVTAGEGSLRLDESFLLMDYTSESPVPEPGTLFLLGSGLLGLGAFKFRRKK